MRTLHGSHLVIIDVYPPRNSSGDYLCVLSTEHIWWLWCVSSTWHIWWLLMCTLHETLIIDVCARRKREGDYWCVLSTEHISWLLMCTLQGTHLVIIDVYAPLNTSGDYWCVRPTEHIWWLRFCSVAVKWSSQVRDSSIVPNFISGLSYGQQDRINERIFHYCGGEKKFFQGFALSEIA